MKKNAGNLVALLALCSLMVGCVTPTGSVNAEAVQEMLASPSLAVTPFQPAWLDADGSAIWPMTEADCEKVRSILKSGTSRDIPELVYQTDDEGAPLARNRFYIYAKNAQCLAGTVLGNRVVMHDVVLTEEQEKELFLILKPYLRRIFTGLA